MEFLRNKPVLVTGGAGLVGSCLIQQLVSEGAFVRATVHWKEAVFLDSAVEYLQCDLTAREDCAKADERVNFVFHCASVSAGAGVNANTPIAHVTANILMNLYMPGTAHDVKVEKFVWLGSTTAYPLAGDRPVTEAEILDGEPYETYFVVGWEKRFMEVLCKIYGEKISDKMTTIVLRPSNVYGPNDNFNPTTSRVTAALIRKVAERQNPIEIWGTGEDIRDHIYVSDVVRAMLLAIRMERSAAFNIGFGRGYSVIDVLQMLLKIDGYTGAKIVYNGKKPSMIPIRLVDTAKAERELGFKARVDLADGLQQTLAWFRQAKMSDHFAATI